MPSRTPVPESVPEERRRAELVFAIGHEIANELGAIRLQAHLLDDELGPRELAEASVAIDGLAARCAPLLALLRPVLTDETAPRPGDEAWRGLLGRIEQEVRDEGTRAVRFEIDSGATGVAPTPDVDWLHPLAMALVQTSLAQAAPRGRVRMRLEQRLESVEGRDRVSEAPGGSSEDGVARLLVLEDDGPEEDLSECAARRGRPLVVGIARLLLGGIGGRVETGRSDETTRIALVFPEPGSPRPRGLRDLR